MQTSNKSLSTLQALDILLFDNFSNHCLANLVEPLRAANTLSRSTIYEWNLYTLDGKPVQSSSGMQIVPQGPIQDGKAATLVVMPSYGFRKFQEFGATIFLRAAASRYDNLIGLDTGSWLLASAGLLDGYCATIHWEELVSFAEAFPDVEVQRKRFVIDGNRITCSGAMATFDLLLRLIGQQRGPLLALEVGQLLMAPEFAGSYTSSPLTSNRTVNQTIRVMQDNLEVPMAISEIARNVGCGQRTLEIRMQSELGSTPQAIYRRLRLNRARKLVTDTDQAVSEIAGRCGYENASAMTRAFKAEFGLTPSSARSGP